MRDNPIRPVYILLVEDNPADVDLTREALETWKILNQLYVAENGEDALAFLRREGKYRDAVRPDLILLDLNLPRKDGREVLGEIKADRFLKTIPIVVLSTSDADIDVIKSYGLGANCYVTKPIGIDNFLSVVQSIGDFWFSIVKLPSKVLIEEYRETLASVAPEEPRAPGRESIDVLLVEDNPADADFIRELLGDQEKPSFAITWVDRLPSAFAWLEKAHFDVAILDLTLPGSQGTETYTALASRYPHLPIIISTGLEDREMALHSIRSGAEDYIGKKDLDGDLLSRVILYSIERKWADEERRTLLLREQAARAAAEKAILARDEFLSIASHELKTPVTSLLMQSQLLGRLASQAAAGGVVLDEKIRRLIQGFEGQSLRLSKLISDLLDLSRISTGRLVLEPAEFDLVELISDALERLGPLFQEAHSPISFRKEGPVVGQWDRYRLDQVLTNLLSNAIKFGAGKPIEVQVSSGGSENSRVQFLVRDHGIGMISEDIPKIFGRFQRLVNPAQYSGLGLGLYIARQIVDAHRGHIRVESEFGKGTTFIVELPLRVFQEAAKSA